MATIKKTTMKKPASKMKKGGTVKKAQTGCWKGDGPSFMDNIRNSIREASQRRQDRRSDRKEDREYNNQQKQDEKNETNNRAKLLSQLGKKDNPIVQRDASTITNDERSLPQGESDFRPSTLDQAKRGKKVKSKMKKGGMVKKAQTGVTKSKSDSSAVVKPTYTTKKSPLKTTKNKDGSTTTTQSQSTMGKYYKDGGKMKKANCGMMSSAKTSMKKGGKMSKRGC
jgi:hypothetical protein